MFVITFTFSGAIFKSYMDHRRSDYNHLKVILATTKVIFATEEVITAVLKII